MERTDSSGHMAASDASDVRSNVAYIKVVEQDGEFAYAVFEADGRLVGIAPTRMLAHVAARQYELMPVDAH